MRIKKEYLAVWEYLKKARFCFFIVLALFLISTLVGFFLPIFLKEYIFNFIEQLMQKTEGMGFFQLFIFIFQNNLTTAFIGMLLGLVFGILPLILAVFNGYVIGFVTKIVVSETSFFSVLRLLPHGIFELPALILSLGLGLKLATFFMSEDKKKQFKYDLENSLRVFLLAILPLLLIAAVIETSLIFLLS